ncbi:MAG: hypothetical protein Q8S41_04830 [Lutibacter sp.]|nr:hypothetical protein [Lutibacter sp.]
MNLFAFKKIHNSTFFEHKTAIIWACPPTFLVGLPAFLVGVSRQLAGRALRSKFFYPERSRRAITNANRFTPFDSAQGDGFTIFLN